MRYKNGILSASFGLLQQVITMVFGLIVPRIFIGTFGSEMNGLLSSLGTIYGYLALLEAGVGTTAIQALYGPLGRNDTQSVNEIMSATAFYYNRAGFFYFVGVIGIAILYPMTVQTNIPYLTIFLITILSGAGGVINFWVQGKYMVLLQAEGKKYLMSIVSIVLYISNNLAKIIFIRNGFSIIAVHLVSFLLGLLQMLFWVLYIKRNYSWLNLHTSKDFEALNQSKSVFIAQIMWMLCSNTDILVLTYFAKDLKAVSVYHIYLMIFSTVEKMFSTVFGSFHYLLGQKYNTDLDRYMSLHRIYEATSMVGSFAFYSIAFCLTTPFMKIYTAGITDAAYVDPFLPLLFTIMHLLSSSREASSRVINFAKHFKEMQWRAVLETVINLTSSIILVHRFGIYGVVIGTIIAYLYRSNDIIIYANKKILNRSPWTSYKIILVNMIVFIGVLVVNSFIHYSINSFVGLFMTAILCGLIIVSIYAVVLRVLSPESIVFLINALKKGIKKYLAVMS